MLPGCVDVAETALQRVGFEQRTAARGLERDSGHPLRHLCDISCDRTRLGLCRLWNTSGLSLSEYARHNLECERPGGRQLNLRLAERGLKVWMSLQRRRRNAAALYQGLRSDLIQRAAGDSKRNAQVEWNSGGWDSQPERGTTSNGVAEGEVHQGESHLFRDKHALEAVF